MRAAGVEMTGKDSSQNIGGMGLTTGATATTATTATTTRSATATGATAEAATATAEGDEGVIIRVRRENFGSIRILGEERLERLVQGRHFFGAGSVLLAKTAAGTARAARSAHASAHATLRGGRGRGGRRGRGRILGEHHREGRGQRAGCENSN